MAPITLAKSERDKKSKLIFNFATRIAERVASETAQNASFIKSDLQDHIKLLPIVVPTARFKDFETQGTDLWNLSTRLSRSDNAPNKTVLCLLRVFAFSLLDSAHKKGGKTSANCVRLLKVAFKAAKACLGCGEVEQGVKVLERATEYLDELCGEDVYLSGEEGKVRDRLEGEYYVLRTTLAYKQSKLDVAEHMYTKIGPRLSTYDAHSAEDLADALYEIGKDLFSKKQYELAVRWLERSYDALGEQDLGDLSDNASELRLCVMQLLAKSMFSLKTKEGIERARHFLSLMDVDFADKMVVGLLKLELLNIEEKPSAEEYFTVLERMFRTIPLTRPNFKTIMHHLHKLRKLDTNLACKALDDLLSMRLYSEDKPEWIERAAMMRIWMTTSSPEMRDDVQQSLLDVLDNVHANTRVRFSAAATYAAQTLLWKQIEKAYELKEYEVVQAWCRLSDHDVFAKCGELNRAKILRKSMLCSLARQDIPSAREAYSKMSESQQNSPQTQYLAYKIGVRSGDAEFAAQSLDLVCKHSGKDATLLYACVLESQQCGDKRQAIAALQKVLEKYDFNAPRGVDLPALLRCTARFLKAEIKNKEPPSEEVMESLCKVFEASAEHAARQKRTLANKEEKVFNSAELNWFSRNSYNIALEFCGVIEPMHLFRMCRSCIQMIELLQAQAAEDEADGLRIRYILCEMLAICAAVVLARSEDNIEDSMQHYLAVRFHSKSLRSLIETHLAIPSIGPATKKDLISKHFESVKYDLEAVLRLSRWDDMEPLFNECFRYEDPNYWDTIADLAFVLNEEVAKAGVGTKYQEQILKFIQRIINTAWKATKNAQNLAKWIRCLFQIAVESSNEIIALYCIDQATMFAKKWKEIAGKGKGKEGNGESNVFPATELEWLAATAFNRAVEFYCVEDDGNCRIWAEKAMMLAGEGSDGGALGRLLQERYKGLMFGKD
ncbi:SPO22-domain-containing protein [Tothia fuscella]|uniref:Protein ZIP4 homolog n=1 Tax=Tothia fuscella TaxID=1048955 RepID=A0A9P4NUX3_9PEZI|nr:SPO22-domain-containing protein [Tothia fuscella]